MSHSSAYPWARLFVSLLLTTVGSCGMYAVVTVLPQVQVEFGTARMGASIPYTLTMIGFGLGGVAMGRLSDRVGVMLPVLLGAECLAAGYLLAAQAGSLVIFCIASFLVGIGCSATFSPLIADTSLWFTRRRGIAVAISASGNYLAGAIWPTMIQQGVEAVGWRMTYAGLGALSLATSLTFAWVLRPRPPVLDLPPMPPAAAPSMPRTDLHPAYDRPLGLSPRALQILICIAGVACCVAMSMPQVHIVALCNDLGYGAIRGAQMLSLMLACGIVSRLLSGWISDRIGGLRTLLLGAVLQAMALVVFLPFQSLGGLYFASALFGLVQGGIVPAYAMVVREFFRPGEVGTRVSLAITSTLLGMALGGWVSGAIYDLTGSYDAAFLHGIAWNLITISIAFMLIRRQRGGGRRLAAA